MVESIARITLDVQDMSTSTMIPVKQGDTGRRIIFSLADGGFPYEIAADCYAVLTATKPDGNILYNHCDIEGNTIVYAVTEQTTAAAGRMACEIKLYGADDALITSARFRIIVDGTIYGDGQVESRDEVSALTHLVSEAATVIQTGNETIAQGQQSIEEVQTATQEAILATDQAGQAATAADEAAESASAAALEADLATGRTNQAIQNAGTATQEASDAAGAANAAADRAQGALTVAEQAAETAAQMADDAEKAVEDAEAAIAGAEKAAAEANEAASRANAASDVAYEARDLAQQADQKVDTLRQVVSQLHSNIVEEAAGQVITLSDSAEAPFQGLKVYGKTEQRTTTGKNLFDVSGIVAKGSYTAMDKTEDSIRIYSTDAAGTYHGIGSDSMILKAGTTYAVSFNMDAYVSGTVRVGFRRYKLGTFVSGASKTGMTATGAYSFTYTPSEDIEAYLSILVTWTTEGDMGDATFSEIQIEVGPEATGYEPYTGGMPSPNPDYPQALESVGDGGSVVSSVCGKNLVDVFNDKLNIGRTGVNYDYDGYAHADYLNKVAEDGTITIDISGTTTYGLGFTKRLLAGETVTISYDVLSPGTSGTALVLNIYDINDYATYKKRVSAAAARKVSCTFTADVDSTYQFGWYVGSGTQPCGAQIKNLQLEFGSAPTDYEPYKEVQTLSVATPSGLPGIPVTSGGNYTDENGQQYIANYRDWGRGVDVQNTETFVFEGTEDIKTLSSGDSVFFYVILKEAYPYVDALWEGRSISSHFLTGRVTTSNTNIACQVRSLSDGSELRIVFRLNNAANMTIELAKEWLTEQYTDGNPFKLIYALATPIETPIPEDELAAYAALHTNYPNTTILNDAGAYMEVEYIADTKMYVDNQFAQLAAALLNNT